MKKTKQLIKFSLMVVIAAIFVYSCKKTDKNIQSELNELKKPTTTAVIGGSPTTIQNVPYQVNVNGAGGAILSKEWIVTAAHVVYGLSPAQVNVVSGTTDITSYPSSRQDRKVDQIIIHKDYSSGGRYNDIALIHLSTPLVLNESTSPVVYATEDEAEIERIDRELVVSGWGLITNVPNTNNGTRTNTLYWTDVKISSLESNLIFSKTPSTEQQGPCYGDSGGPYSLL